ncbi:hypothetical protein [Deinococcus sedimenti]|uniref:Uncharacterized protein n=1 Tax=Deinococcus sedimenti TaxID=1867090 RepID=A0ABQ2S481_9DEIO|nr:hypothetical protein [Deinococcus sedimenti]GGR84591.1 hypothetical protein GCM10008960_09530 [Deinococcus sedimenti]
MQTQPTRTPTIASAAAQYLSSAALSRIPDCAHYAAGIDRAVLRPVESARTPAAMLEQLAGAELTSEALWALAPINSEEGLRGWCERYAHQLRAGIHQGGLCTHDADHGRVLLSFCPRGQGASMDGPLPTAYWVLIATPEQTARARAEIEQQAALSPAERYAQDLATGGIPAGLSLRGYLALDREERTFRSGGTPGGLSADEALDLIASYCTGEVMMCEPMDGWTMTALHGEASWRGCPLSLGAVHSSGDTAAAMVNTNEIDLSVTCMFIHAPVRVPVTQAAVLAPELMARLMSA